MVETLIGGLMGGAFRCIPEILNFFDKKHERSHELSMQDKQLEYTRMQGAQKMDEIGAESQLAWNTGYLETLKTALSSQGQKSGIAWLDAINISVRPVITYWFFSLYCAAKICLFAGALMAGAGWIETIKNIWTVDDQAMLSGLLNFWFLNRVFEKAKT